MISYISKISAVFILSLLVLSCEGSKTIDEVFATVTRGAVFRALDIESSSFNLFDPSSVFSITAEVEDHENGELLDNVEVYIAFVDNTEDGTDYSVEEQLFTTLERNMFTTGSNGLPTTSFSISLSEISAALNVAPENYTGGDNFTVRFELRLTDGRRFSSDNVGATVSGGSFFRSPFIYSVNVNCVPLIPVEGEYTIAFTDTYGDGWDGAFITVIIDGVSTDYTIEDGSEGTVMFTVPPGAQSLVLIYTAGNFEGEHIYSITAPDGGVAASDGPGPLAGEIVLSICP